MCDWCSRGISPLTTPPNPHDSVATCRASLTVLLLCLLGTASVLAGPENPAVEDTIRAAAQATATFSETRNRQAVLQLYTEDYEGIQDGQAETKAAIAKWLDEYEAELKRGSGLRFISAVSNIETGVSGTVAWATYDYVFQAMRDGELEGQDAGKCTALLRKDNSTWLIFHEHCSKTRAVP